MATKILERRNILPKLLHQMICLMLCVVMESKNCNRSKFLNFCQNWSSVNKLSEREIIFLRASENLNVSITAQHTLGKKYKFHKWSGKCSFLFFKMYLVSCIYNQLSFYNACSMCSQEWTLDSATRAVKICEPNGRAVQMIRSYWPACVNEAECH